MPHIYCHQCFPNAPLEQTPLNPVNSLHTINLQNLICNGNHNFAAQRVSSVRSTINSVAPTSYLVNQTPAHAALRQWVEKGTATDRDSRSSVATQLLDSGAFINSSGALEVQGPCRIANTLIESLPDNLVVVGDLFLSSCPNLKALPDFMQVTGKLALSDCQSITEVPELINAGSLALINLRNLQKIAGSCAQYAGDVFIDSCRRLDQMPISFEVGGKLTINNCPSLPELPLNLSVHGDCKISECEDLRRLPPKAEFYQHLEVVWCSQFNLIPDTTLIRGNINVSNNQSLNRLPSALLQQVSINHLGNEREINIAQSGFSDRFLDQVESSPLARIFYTGNSTFSDMEFSDSESVDTRLHIVIRPGHEYEDMSQKLSDEPDAHTFIQYAGNKAVDEGGVSRQAFTEGLKQMMVQNPIFVKSSTRQAFINSFDISNQKEGHQLKRDAYVAGVFLGGFNQLNLGTAKYFDEVFYKSLHDVVTNMKDVTIIYDAQQVADFLENPQTGINDVLQLVKTLRPSMLKPSMFEHYRQDYAQEELRELRGETLLYLNLAQGLENAGFHFENDYMAFYKSLVGVVDLKQELISHMKYLQNEHTHVSSTEAKQVLDWVKHAIHEADDDRMPKLMQDLTGAENIRLTKPFFVTLATFNKKDVVFNSHTCSFSLDVNIETFRDLVKTNNFEYFRDNFLIGASKVLNGA